MKSKTKINRQMKRKNSPELFETILLAKKNKGWKRVAEILSSPRSQSREKNLSQIDVESKEGEIIVFPGKILSMGEINKKLKIIALKFSKGAEEKIKKSGGNFSIILEEIKKNPEAKGVRILE